MRVDVLVLRGCTALPAVGVYDLLHKAGRLPAGPEAPEPAPRMDLRLVSCDDDLQARAANGLTIPCHAHLDEVWESDLVVVPAFDGDVLAQLQDNRAVVPWLVRAYERGADLASVCTGAFALAEAGLLDGRAATTHWAAQDLFRSRYPRVDLRVQEIIVDEGRLCTCGGATSFLNLVVYLVDKHLGPEAAFLAGRMFLIDPKVSPQGAYAVFHAQKGHGDGAILRAQSMIEERYRRPLTVDDLARHAVLSRRTLIRRFKRATGNTPIEYIQRVRVEAAKRSLSTGRQPLTEVAWSVGYRDPAAFRRTFVRFAGLSPSEYRRRYHVAGAART